MANPVVIVRRKRALRDWANKTGVPLPKGFKAGRPTMGTPARALLAIFQLRNNLSPTGVWNQKTVEKLLPPQPRVIYPKWQWNGSLSRRSGRPPFVVVHNAAAVTAAPEAIHSFHKSRGFLGIGYHRYIRKDGSIYQGRPLWAMGAHTMYYNHCIGVCCEGNYDTERTMPAAQFKALEWCLDDLRSLYPGIRVKGHREMPNNATSCPGIHFPLKKFR
jgi:hypothetical protein